MTLSWINLSPILSAGMLLRLFVYMYDHEVIEEEVFLRWKEEVNDEYPGKGKALFQVIIPLFLFVLINLHFVIVDLWFWESIWHSVNIGCAMALCWTGEPVADLAGNSRGRIRRRRLRRRKRRCLQSSTTREEHFNYTTISPLYFFPPALYNKKPKKTRQQHLSTTQFSASPRSSRKALLLWLLLGSRSLLIHHLTLATSFSEDIQRALDFRQRTGGRYDMICWRKCRYIWQALLPICQYTDLPISLMTRSDIEALLYIKTLLTMYTYDTFWQDCKAASWHEREAQLCEVRYENDFSLQLPMVLGGSLSHTASDWRFKEDFLPHSHEAWRFPRKLYHVLFLVFFFFWCSSLLYSRKAYYMYIHSVILSRSLIKKKNASESDTGNASNLNERNFYKHNKTKRDINVSNSSLCTFWVY